MRRLKRETDKPDAVVALSHDEALERLLGGLRKRLTEAFAHGQRVTVDFDGGYHTISATSHGLTDVVEHDGDGSCEYVIRIGQRTK